MLEMHDTSSNRKAANIRKKLIEAPENWKYKSLIAPSSDFAQNFAPRPIRS